MHTLTMSSASQGRKSSFLNWDERERNIFAIFATRRNETEAWAFGFCARTGRSVIRNLHQMNTNIQDIAETLRKGVLRVSEGG